MSVTSASELREVLSLGPEVIDYVGLGPVHATRSKKDHKAPIGNRGIRDLVGLMHEAKSPIKAVAIGGINAGTLPALMAQAGVFIADAGEAEDAKSQSQFEAASAAKDSNWRTIDGIAVVSAISAAENPRNAAAELKGNFLTLCSSVPSALTHDPSRPRTSDTLVAAACALLQQLRDRASAPAVCQNITNSVVMNDTANLTLALSSSPIMSSSAEEAADLSLLIGALVLNMGTLNPAQVAGATAAGKAANRIGKPVVLDPVGVGASAYRKDTIAKLMDDVHVTVLKGNAGEIGAIAGLTEVQSRGVDSAGGAGFKDPAKVVRSLAQRESELKLAPIPSSCRYAYVNKSG